MDHEASGLRSPEALGVKLGAETNGLPRNLEDDGFSYETPPQNKENAEEDNEVFYSSKKYLSVERSYKLRLTPMRTLQYNGSTPLRESRISSKKKKKKKSKIDFLPIQTEETQSEESVFALNKLMESLPHELTSEVKQSDKQTPIEQQSNVAPDVAKPEEDGSESVELMQCHKEGNQSSLLALF